MASSWNDAPSVLFFADWYLGRVHCAWCLRPQTGGGWFCDLPKSGEAVSDPEQDNRKRNLKIAKNEAARELKSDVRLTSWAIAVAVVVALIVLAIFLKR